MFGESMGWVVWWVGRAYTIHPVWLKGGGFKRLCGWGGQRCDVLHRLARALPASALGVTRAVRDVRRKAGSRADRFSTPLCADSPAQRKRSDEQARVAPPRPCARRGGERPVLPVPAGWWRHQPRGPDGRWRLRRRRLRRRRRSPRGDCAGLPLPLPRLAPAVPGPLLATALTPRVPRPPEQEEEEEEVDLYERLGAPRAGPLRHRTLAVATSPPPVPWPRPQRRRVFRTRVFRTLTARCTGRRRAQGSSPRRATGRSSRRTGSSRPSTTPTSRRAARRRRRRPRCASRRCGRPIPPRPVPSHPIPYQIRFQEVRPSPRAPAPHAAPRHTSSRAPSCAARASPPPAESCPIPPQSLPSRATPLRVRRPVRHAPRRPPLNRARSFFNLYHPDPGPDPDPDSSDLDPDPR